MSFIDWAILVITLVTVILYGIYKGRGQRDAQSYLLADKKMPWYLVLLGIMSTQASAITFISAPGQAFTDGMRFVQYYFGLPIAMIVICVTFIPIFQKLNVYTAYEFLEERFDRKTRVFTSFLFLLSRGLSTGISIYAPSIVLASVLGMNIYLTNLLMGGLLIIYTCSGGAKAIAHTQKLQFIIILASMAFAGYLVIRHLPSDMTAGDALFIAGKAGKLNVITSDFDWKDKYNIWSGIIGGFFLALSYFGTDQSQVGRYLTAKDTSVARKGLLLNGLVKIPMQFAILLIGALLFSLYIFKPAPLYFNEASYRMLKTKEPVRISRMEKDYAALGMDYRKQAEILIDYRRRNIRPPQESIAAFKHTNIEIDALRDSVRQEIARTGTASDASDTNYIFLHFVKNYLPRGLVGLLFAIIFLASWGSVSAALNSLASSSLIDIQYLGRKERGPASRQVRYGRVHTVIWGGFSIAVAMFATQMGSLIEAVNVLGSLFYGTILGIFLVAFYLKSISGNAVFLASVIAELSVIVIYKADIVSFLWLNMIGALLVILISSCLQLLSKKKIYAA